MTTPPDATATAAAIREGRVTVREVVAEAIGRIEKYDPELNAVVNTRFDETFAEVDAGLPAGPLHGVPVLVKDLGASVAGLPHTDGSRVFADRVAAEDSEVVARYRRAGMVVLGTTNSAEFGLNASTEPALFGPTSNPWDPAYSPGGSSGGSAAAVAAGMVPVAHGSDGGGSIRIPAAMCGLFGLKPSRGRVPASPFATTFANPVSAHHALTTTVRDSALLLDIAAGGLPGDVLAAPTPTGSFVAAAGSDPGPLRIGLVTSLPSIPTDPEAEAAAIRAAELCTRLGHVVEPVEAPYDPAETGAAGGMIMGANLVATLEGRLAEMGRGLHDKDVEPFTRVLHEYYRTLPVADLNRALREAQRIGWQVGRAFGEVDLLLTPTLAAPAPRLGELDTARPETVYERGMHYSGYTSVFNLTGMPAMSVPFGTTEGGLPLGVQFAADLGGEETLLSLAAQLEEAAPWQRTRIA